MDIINILAWKSHFDPDQIVADVVCPDYNGDELFRLADAFNALPKNVRSNIVKILEENQRKFAQAIVRECIRCCDDIDVIQRHYLKYGIDQELGASQCVEVIKKHFHMEDGVCACCGVAVGKGHDEECIWYER